MNDIDIESEMKRLRERVSRLEQLVEGQMPQTILALALVSIPSRGGRPAKADVDAAIARIVPDHGSFEAGELLEKVSRLYDRLFPLFPA